MRTARNVKMPPGMDYAALETDDNTVSVPAMVSTQTSEPMPVRKLKLIQRGIAKAMIPVGELYQPVEQVEAYVSEWLDKGYRLANTHYLGEDQNFFNFFFVLVKD